MNRRVTWKGAGLTAAAVLAVAAVSLWAGRQAVVRLVATQLLDRQGMGPARMTVDSLGLFGLRARDISLYGGAVRAAELTMRYDLRHLAIGVVDQVALSGLRLQITAAGNDIMVGGVPLRFASASSGTSSTAGLRIDALRITDAQVAFDSPRGRVEAAFSTTLALSDAAIRNASFAVDLSGPVAGAVRVVHITAPEFALSAPDDGGLHLAFDKVAIEPRDLPWKVDQLGGEFLWQGDQVLARIRTGRVSDLRTQAAIVPLNVSGEATLAGSQLDFTLHAAAEAHGGKGTFSLTAIGQHDVASGEGRSSIAVPPIVFRADGLQPGHFLPASGGALAGLAGSVALSGAVSWHDAALSPALVLHLADLAYEAPGARLSGFRGDIHLAGLWPPATAAGQALTGVVTAGGMAPAATTLTFQLLPTPALRIQSMRMDLVGGQISASPFLIDLGRPDITTTLAFRQIDLGQAVDFLGVDGLRGTGRLDGQIPLTVSGGHVLVHDGRLAASGPGVLQLRSGALPKQVTDAGESMTLALRALEDFHYRTLTLELARGPTGDGTLLLRLQGNNPAVLDGRAFNLNIKLESNFDRLVELALESMAAAQELLRRAAGSARQ